LEIDIVPEYLRVGEPSDREIQMWITVDGDLYDMLATRPVCPECGSARTRWIRQQWCVCFSCESSFTTPEPEGQEDRDFWELFE